MIRRNESSISPNHAEEPPLKKHSSGCLCEQIARVNIEQTPLCIGKLWIFENLEVEELKALIQTAIRETYKPGQTIFMQGDPAKKMFLIKAGRVKLSKLMEDGDEITIDIRKAGDFFGENMVSEEIEYSFSAWCMEDTLLCGFTKERFERLVLEYPNIGLQVIKNLNNRIHWLTSHVGSLSMTNLEDRLYQILVNVARDHGIRKQKGYAIQFPLTHEDLSFLVGAHRVSITRAMKSLRESGKILREGRTLILPLERPEMEEV
jgi:CRP/FNR family transcriptional regulator